MAKLYAAAGSSKGGGSCALGRGEMSVDAIIYLLILLGIQIFMRRREKKFNILKFSSNFFF